MKRQELVQQIKRKGSFLCVGLDPDIKKLPVHLLDDENPIYSFNRAIIDATAQYAVAFKPNLAFYEAQGLKGWEAFELTVKYIKENYPEIFIIADAKRGDIGNLSIWIWMPLQWPHTWVVIVFPPSLGMKVNG